MEAVAKRLTTLGEGFGELLGEIPIGDPDLILFVYLDLSANTSGSSQIVGSFFLAFEYRSWIFFVK